MPVETATVGTAAAVTVRTVASLTEIGPAAWDAVAVAGPLQQSYGYLRTVEVVPGVVARYATATDPDGRLLGALPLYLPGSVAGPNPPVTSLLRHLPLGEESPPAWRSAVYAGAAHGFRNAPLVAADLAAPDRQRVLSALLDAAEAVRERTGAGAVLHRHLLDGTEEILTGAVPGAVALVQDAEAVLELPGAGWDDYLAGMGSRRRSDVRRDGATFASAGLTTSYGRLGDHWRAVAELSAQVFQRYGRVDAGAERQARYRHIVAHWSADLDVLLVHRDERLVGFSLVVPWGEDLYVLDYGLDYARAGDHAEYFHLVYYEPIRLAYRLNLRRVQLGRGSMRAKTLRGAQARPLWTVASGATPSADRVTQWNAEALARLGLAGRPPGPAEDRSC
jgi:predicted N-acyltransferase